MDSSALVLAVLGLVGGGGAVWLMLVRPSNREVAELREAKEALLGKAALAEASAKQCTDLQTELAASRRQLSEKETALAEIRTRREAEQTAAEARIQDLTRLSEEMNLKFGDLARNVFDNNSEAFLNRVTERFNTHQETASNDLEGRRKAIETLVSPLTEKLGILNEVVKDIEGERKGAYASIRTQVESLAKDQATLRGETSKLVTALRAPKVRGRWGELHLTRVLEITGMTPHIDFVPQETIEGDEGALRPDVIVKLPGGKSLVIDAKTPLDAYLAALDCVEEADRQAKLKAHSQQVRSHVRALSAKKYWDSLDFSPDFVIMFVPGESFFAAALEQDARLLEEAFADKVLIANPTTLVSLLKAVAYGWQQQAIADNAKEISDLASELCDRVKTFVGHLEASGSGLQSAVTNYNKMIASLEGRVLVTTRKLEVKVKGNDADNLPPPEPIALAVRAAPTLALQGNIKVDVQPDA